ncbi:cell division control protein 7 [Enteropsectra breve]|nr:cell division control protein 7 [Enteropsectra breve]
MAASENKTDEHAAKENFECPYNLQFCEAAYEILGVVGGGTFSTVYMGVNRKTGENVALKAILRTVSPNRIMDELEILHELNGENNCVKLLDVLRENDQIVLVFPLIPAVDFKEFLPRANGLDLRRYMYSLITAVCHIHNHNIVHRDIKPGNFLFCEKLQAGFLIDFGLAHHEKLSREKPEPVNQPPVLFLNPIIMPSAKPPGYYEDDSRPEMKAPRAGTRGFKAPEVLFKHSAQNRSIDMWSVGVIMLSFITMRYPFFLCKDDLDGLAELALIYGKAEMRKAARLYGRLWKCNIPDVEEERMTFAELINKLNPAWALDEDTLNLLERMLDLNCNTRITADEALKHSFFKD